MGIREGNLEKLEPFNKGIEKRKMSATIKDVAKIAGVSTSTASLALNDKPRVSKKTKAKVLEAAQMLDYYPNIIARGLVKRKTNNLALVISHTADYIFFSPYFIEIVRGISNTTNSLGYRLMISIVSAEIEEKSAYIQIIKEGSIDGLFLLDVRLRDERILELKRENFPFVVIGRDFISKGVSYVDPDDTNGACQAVRHLASLGHKKIAFINGHSDYMVSFDRLEGYRKALAEAELSYNPNLVRHSGFTQESGYRMMKGIINDSSDFTALFTASDLMAMGAMKAIKEKGLGIPEDIAVVGFDDIPAAAFADPPLTTVRQPICDIGALAAKILIGIVEGKRVNEKHIIMPTQLIIRKSCGSRKEK